MSADLVNTTVVSENSPKNETNISENSPEAQVVNLESPQKFEEFSKKETNANFDELLKPESSVQESSSRSTPSLTEESSPIAEDEPSPRSNSSTKSSTTVTPGLSPSVPHKQTLVISPAKEEPLTPDNQSKRNSRKNSRLLHLLLFYLFYI